MKIRSNLFDNISVVVDDSIDGGFKLYISSQGGIDNSPLIPLNITGVDEI